MPAESTGLIQQFTDTRAIVARDLYSRALANALLYPIAVPDGGFALNKDVNAYELVRQDAVFKALLETRQHMVAGTTTRCEPTSDDPIDADLASVLQDVAFSRIENLESAKLNLAQAVFLGSSYAKIEGTRVFAKFGKDRKTRVWWVPTRLIDIDRRRVRHVVDRKTDPENPRWTTEIADVHDNARWKVVTPEQDRWLLRNVYDDSESTLGYGRGLLNSLYTYWYAKTVALVEGLGGLERWARGFVTYEVDPDRPGSKDVPNSTVVNDAVNNLAKHMSRHILAYMKGEKVDVLPGPGQGHQIVMDLITYLDNGAARLLLGSVLTSGGDSDKGSLARGRVEQDTMGSVIRMDMKLCGRSLQPLARLVFEVNRGNFAQLGLNDAQLPNVVLGEDENETPALFLERLKLATDAGLKIKTDEAYKGSGFSQPAEGDETIESKPEPSPFGMPPGGGGSPPFGGGESKDGEVGARDEGERPEPEREEPDPSRNGHASATA